MNKNLGGFVVVAGVVVAVGLGGWLMASEGGQPVQVAEPAPLNVPTIAAQTGIQTLEITAKGGYSPAETTLKADAPAFLHIITNSTFDCSSSLVIPALNFQARLPMTGTTEINIPPQPAGTVITGLCSMGMYSFTIHFG